jgi:hypothetical protein
LWRFALKTAKNRLKGDFLPCKLPKEPINRGFFGTKYRKNLQVPQAPRDAWARRGEPSEAKGGKVDRFRGQLQNPNPAGVL